MPPKRSFFSSLRNRLFLALIGLVVLPGAVLGNLSFVLNRASAQQVLSGQLSQLAAVKASQVEAWITDLRRDLAAEAEGPASQEMAALLADPASDHEEVERLRQHLQEVVRLRGGFNQLALLDRQGRLVTTSTPAGQPAAIPGAEALIAAAAASQQPVVQALPPETSQPAGVLLLAAPVYGGRPQAAGFLVGQARLERLAGLLAPVEGSPGGLGFLLLGAEGVPLTQADPAGVSLPPAAGSPLALSLNSPAGGLTLAGADRRQVILAHHAIGGTPATVVAQADLEAAIAPSMSWISLNGLLALATAVVTIVIAVFFVRSITRPIRQLTATAEKISAGSLEQEAESSSISEFDQLARAFNSMTAQLRRSINELEVRVARRTLELEQRTQQLQVAGEIARDIALETGLDELLDRAVNLIRERFGFYHAGIFLLDDRKEYALLRAATGEAGREMLARGHRLLVGQVGIVGYAAGSGKARIALDVSADSAHYRNPLLPETRSEMALPLRVGTEVIGALDVQSKKVGAFHEDDISTLQTMADQLAVAIENARLIDRLNQTVVELERSYAQYTEQAWSRLSARQDMPAGYRYHENRVDALDESTAEGLPTRTAVTPLPTPPGGEAPGVLLRTPLILRKQVIGVLNLNFRQAVVPPETIQLVEAAAERLALILDNARLLEEAQRRAARERLVGEIGAKLRASNNPQEILHTAVQELQQALHASKAQVTLREGGQPLNPLETGGAPAAGNGQLRAR